VPERRECIISGIPSVYLKQVIKIKTKLTGGRGYIEKDWGVSIPSSGIWMWTNLKALSFRYRDWER
jgi:hypothetical protein